MGVRRAIGQAVEVALRGEFTFLFDKIPIRARRIRGRKLVNLARIALNRYTPVRPAVGYPYMAHVSPSGLCNLTCERCPAVDDSTVGRTRLDYEVYERFMKAAGPYLLYVILWSWGEPLLNRDLYRMVGLANSLGVSTVTSTNMLVFDREQAREMVESGLDVLIVAIDGAKAETYECLRPGGSFEDAVGNLRILLEERDRAGSDTPYVNLRLVVSKKNENEIEAFRQLGRDLGVDMISFKAYSTRQAGYEDLEWDSERAPESVELRWYEYSDDFTLGEGDGRYDGRFPWTKPTVFAAGSILACEFDLEGDHALGNLNDQGFEDIWFGEKAKKLRRDFRPDRLPFCKDCVFDGRVIEGCVLEAEYLRDTAS